MNPGFRTSIKGKIIIIFLISSLALTGSYFVNKYTFGQIRSAVKDLSYTNEKLVLVNNLFSGINESENAFRNMLTYGSAFDTFVAQSAKLRVCCDSLKALCTGNFYQVSLIDSIGKLLQVRQKLLINYVDFRRALRSSNRVLEQASLLDSLIAIGSAQTDSLVLSQEQNRIVTKIDSVEIEQPEKKGFWKKIFGSKKKDPPKVRQIVQEEISTKVDTIVQTRKDDLAEEAQRIISAIGSEQSIRRKKLFKRESALTAFENSFHNQISNLLSEIEKDITHQTRLTQQQAEQGIGGSMNRVYVIISCFFLFALIIMLLLLTDVAKSNKYRLLLEQAKEDAELQSLARQRFLSNMSHEIRTPLQSVIGYAEQLSRQERPDQSHIDAIRNASGHLLQVINEILDYSKIHSGHFSFERNTFRLDQVLEEVCSMIRYMAEQKGLSLRWDQAALRDEYLCGDAFRLRQILLNLLGNAVKFTEQGYIAFTAAAIPYDTRTRYTFTITDTGIGIPYDMQERIFDQFEQANLPMEHRYKGTGLGLGIVRALVEGQGGSISVSSVPGEGATFTFSLEYDRTGAPSGSLPPAGPGTAAYGGEVWLVDDDGLILQLCTAILTRHHIPHQYYASAEALLRVLQEAPGPPATVLLDIRMPGKNGFQLYDEVRGRYGNHTRIIALTAQALPEETEAILRHGFDDILLKPFREEELIARCMKKEHSMAAPATKEEDGDPAIWQLYLRETAADLERLQAAVDGHDAEEAAMQLHRLAGRTAQIGFKELGARLRRQEIEVRSSGLAGGDMLGEVMLQVRRLLQESTCNSDVQAEPAGEA